MTAPSVRSRGFTLVELLIASTIVILVIGTAMMGFLSQNRGLQAMDLTRVANTSIRDALLQLEGSLRTAGWGVDPRWAVDMRYRCSAAAVTCRDRVDGADELVILSRSPMYRWLENGMGGCATAGGCFSGKAWRIQAVDLATTPRTVTITLGNGQVLEYGRVVMATCALGQSPVMLTLSNKYTGDGVAQQTLVPLTGNNPPYNDFNSLSACHGATGAGLFVVERSRYFVSTVGGTPWLMLDSGYDVNGDNVLPESDPAGLDLVPIAENVEDMQVAYVLQPIPGQTAPDSGQDWILGNEKGVAEEPQLSAGAPTYTTKSNDPLRATLHPANVRGVRVTLTVRSARADPRQDVGWAGESVPGAENRNGQLTGGGFLRFTTRTDVSLRNMDSKGPFIF